MHAEASAFNSVFMITLFKTLVLQELEKIGGTDYEIWTRDPPLILISTT